jgi:hypothetical protein
MNAAAADDEAFGTCEVDNLVADNVAAVAIAFDIRVVVVDDDDAGLCAAGAKGEE